MDWLRHGLVGGVVLVASLLIPGISSASSVQIITNDPLRFEKPKRSCGVKICTTLLSLIGEATESIDFAIYGIRNQRVSAPVTAN